MPENLEKKSKIEDSKFVEKFREVFAVELEKLREQRPAVIGDDPEKVVLGELIGDKQTQWSVFVRIGQDFRLLPDEIDELGKQFFKK